MTRQKCDLCLGTEPKWDWCVEVKMVRFLGDNGKANDNILMHVLSPYPAHRSALTECSKLVASSFKGRKSILIFGYEHEEWPLAPAIDAFVVLAERITPLRPAGSAEFDNLVHPVHSRGRVYAWELLA
jgi:hypothetical protein